MANLARFPKDSEIKLNLIEIVVRWVKLTRDLRYLAWAKGTGIHL